MCACVYIYKYVCIYIYGHTPLQNPPNALQYVRILYLYMQVDRQIDGDMSINWSINHGTQFDISTINPNVIEGICTNFAHELGHYHYLGGFETWGSNHEKLGKSIYWRFPEIGPKSSKIKLLLNCNQCKLGDPPFSGTLIWMVFLLWENNRAGGQAARSPTI